MESSMFKARIAMLIVPTLLAGALASAGAQDRNDNQDRRDHGNFDNGVRDGGDGGYYNGEHRPLYRRQYQTQYNNGYYNNGDSNGAYNNGAYNNGASNNGAYNNGAYNNGAYNNREYKHGDYRNGYHQHQGGVGPGKGALIGGAGGAILGGLLSHGLGGALLGGAAGAGIGAIAGKVHQNHQRDQYGNYYPQ